MASLWKHPKSKYWTACYTDHAGMQRKKSTKQTERSKAMTIALEFERAEQKAREGQVTEAQCRKVLSEILERTTGETFRHATTEEFLKGWISGKTGSKSEGTSLRYSHSIEIFLKSLGGKAKLAMQAVTPRDVEKFRDAELKKGKAGSTVAVDLKTVRTAFNLAVRQAIIPSNPVNAVELPSEERHERGTFTPEQFAALLHGASSEWKTAILFGYHIGARIGDAVTMRLKNIDFVRKAIEYKQSKTGRQVTCPMGSELEAHLLGLPIPDDKPDALLTPGLAEKPVGGRSGLSREFKDLMSRAKVDDGRIASNGGTGRSFSKLSFHALRHTYVTDAANAGISEEIRMKVSGHTNKSVHSKYTKLELDTLQTANAQLEKFRKGKGATL